jgi:DNA-binding response OmpR family regulator
MPDTLLIIDDDVSLISMLQMGLETEGFKIASAQNPVTGWKEMESCQPDIILVDWEMPEMDGIEFIRLLKNDAAHRDRYIIMITGRSNTESIVEGLNAGANDYLAKPFKIEELIARVRSGLRIRSLERRIADEAKQLTVFEMALSVADKVGNPVAAAKFHQQLLMEDARIASR